MQKPPIVVYKKSRVLGSRSLPEPVLEVVFTPDPPVSLVDCEKQLEEKREAERLRLHGEYQPHAN